MRTITTLPTGQICFHQRIALSNKGMWRIVYTVYVHQCCMRPSLLCFCFSSVLTLGHPDLLSCLSLHINNKKLPFVFFRICVYLFILQRLNLQSVVFIILYFWGSSLSLYSKQCILSVHKNSLCVIVLMWWYIEHGETAAIWIILELVIASQISFYLYGEY